jgi:hypothetical protein
MTYTVKFNVLKTHLFFLILMAFLYSCQKPEESAHVQKSFEKTSEVEISRRYRAPLFFFTSYRCRGCGSFGKPVTERVIESMGDSLVPMVCHFKYGDPFENQTNLDIIESQGGDRSSPQIYWEGKNEIFKLFGLGQNGSVEYLRNEIREDFGKVAKVYVGLKAEQKENGRWSVQYAAENATNEKANYRVEIYSNEDGLISIQKGAQEEENQIHDNVIRSGHFGDMGKPIELEAKSTFSEEVEVIPCSDCVPEDLYFTLVVWEDLGDGRMQYVNGLVFRP